MPSKFCAVRLVSIISSDPPTYTYRGYECDCDQGTVTRPRVLQSFTAEIPIPDPPPDLPSSGDLCNCADTNCQEFPGYPAPAAHEEKPDCKQKRKKPGPSSLQIPPDLEIIGQWNAESERYHGEFLLLVLFQDDAYDVFGVAYRFQYQSPMGGNTIWFDDESLIFTMENGRPCVRVGTLQGQQLGPFTIV